MREELRPGVYLQTGVTRAEWTTAVRAEEAADAECARAKYALTEARAFYRIRHRREKEEAKFLKDREHLAELKAETMQEEKWDPDGFLKERVRISKRRRTIAVAKRRRMETTDDGGTVDDENGDEPIKWSLADGRHEVMCVEYKPLGQTDPHTPAKMRESSTATRTYLTVQCRTLDTDVHGDHSWGDWYPIASTKTVYTREELERFWDEQAPSPGVQLRLVEKTEWVRDEKP